MKTHLVVDNQQISEDLLPLWHLLLVREADEVAKELHNDLAQVLLALRLDISLFLLQQQQHPDLVKRVNAMLAMTDQCTKSLSGLVSQLRPPDFDQGLPATLDLLCRNFRKLTQIPCELLIASDCKRLDRVKVSLIYRLVNEALHNIVQHAQSTQVEVKVSHSRPDYLQLYIMDNGSGFELDHDIKSRHLGIRVMRECALQLQAQFQIVSIKNQGTELMLELPLTRK